jgi:hypothetical protein
MVNISGSDSIGNCEKKIRKNMCLILIGYQDTAVWKNMCLILIGYQDTAVWKNVCLILNGYRDTAVWTYSSAPVSRSNTFQDLPRLRKTADNAERYI